MIKYVLIFLFLSFTYILNAQSSSSLFKKANDEFLIGNYSSAINYCTKAIKKNKTIFQANFIMGLSYYNLKDTLHAKYYFKEELKNNKTDYRPYLYIAKLSINDYFIAQTYFTKAITIQPDNFLLYYEKGNLNYYHHNYELALDDYSKAISLRTHLDEAYYYMGFCNLNLKDSVNACNNWSKINELDDFENYELIEKICTIK